MKTLIINGSPRKNGDTVALLSEFKKQIHGEVSEISAYYDKIQPCKDCRLCQKQKGCAIKDDMSKIYADDFDIVVIASPLYMSNLTGPLMSLASRFQAYYAAKHFLKDEITVRKKTAVLILVGGGDGGPEPAITLSKWMFKNMNANFSDENVVLSLHTDNLPAKDDLSAISRIDEIALQLNQINDHSSDCGYRT